MNSRTFLFAIAAFLLMLGIGSSVGAEDVVYLKDGSVIHGTITEETPSVSLKIETRDGNVFVYKVKQIKKITHTKPVADDADNADETDNGQAEAPKIKQGGPVVMPRFVPGETDPHARFSKLAFMVNAGFWGPGTFSNFNDVLESGTGVNTYDFLPGYVKAGLGIGWFTNNFGLKWNIQVSYQPNDYSTDWYYGGYYAGTTSESTYILLGGTEVEAELAFDTVVNKDKVTSLYIPVIAGIWEEQYGVSTDAGSDTFTATTEDFGAGIGFRGFDSSKFFWDVQCVYRGCTRGKYLVDPNGYQIPNANGSYLDANVSGLDLNFTIGVLAN